MSSSQQLPFLPGYRIESNVQKNYPKQHMFDVRNGIRVDINREQGVIDQRAFPVADNEDLLIAKPSEEFQASAKFASTAGRTAGAETLPAWVAYDRKVLRFYGFFKEPVYADARETYRVRKCVLYFYLEDGSVHIAEPKVENSGIPQGVFIKRHRIPKRNGQVLSVEDLAIGAELELYGRVFRLVDCDGFTRSFYQEIGMAVREPEAYPLDPFTIKHSQQSHTFHKLMNPLKNFMEASLGKPIGASIHDTQKFLKNDRKVLRFFCVWSDQKMYGEQRPYVLHFFLADDTVEVMEIKQPNSGRDAFPALLKRQKLPKNFNEITPDVSRIGWKPDEKVQYYTEEDFRIGETVQVYGRKLLITGCDEFTKNFYIMNFEMSPDDFPSLQIDDAPEAGPIMIPPPHNGFGTEEDSLGSFLYLNSKVPRRNFKQLVENDGLNMRFLAKFVNPAPEDKNRRFIITFYLNNDTVSIFEKFERNSGFIGGKFLERARLKNTQTGEYFKATDFFIGASLVLNHTSFDVIDSDEFTLKFMENNPEVFGVDPNGRNASAAGAGAEPDNFDSAPADEAEVAF
jgi:hypothetical protein